MNFLFDKEKVQGTLKEAWSRLYDEAFVTVSLLYINK